MVSPAISQNYAPPPSVTTDMGTHAGVGYPGDVPQTVFAENPFPQGGSSLGNPPPEFTSHHGGFSLGNLPPLRWEVSLYEASHPQVTSVTMTASGFPTDHVGELTDYTSYLTGNHGSPRNLL